MAAGSPICLSSRRPHRLAPFAGRGTAARRRRPTLSDHPKEMRTLREQCLTLMAPRPSRMMPLWHGDQPERRRARQLPIGAFSKGFLHKQPGACPSSFWRADATTALEGDLQGEGHGSSAALRPGQGRGLLRGRRRESASPLHGAAQAGGGSGRTQRAASRAQIALAGIRHRHESQGASVIQEHYRRRQSRKQLEEEARSSDARARLAKEELARRQVMAHRIGAGGVWVGAARRAAREAAEVARGAEAAGVLTGWAARTRPTAATHATSSTRRLLHENASPHARRRCVSPPRSRSRRSAAAYKCERRMRRLAAYGRIRVMRVNIKVVMAANVEAAGGCRWAVTRQREAEAAEECATAFGCDASSIAASRRVVGRWPEQAQGRGAT